MRKYTIDMVLKARRTHEGKTSEKKVMVVDLSLGIMCRCLCVFSSSSRTP